MLLTYCRPPFGAMLLILPRGRALLHHVSSLERLVRNQMMLLGCQWRFDRWHRILLEEGSVFSFRRCCQLQEGGLGCRWVIFLGRLGRYRFLGGREVSFWELRETFLRSKLEIQRLGEQIDFLG